MIHTEIFLWPAIDYKPKIGLSRLASNRKTVPAYNSACWHAIEISATKHFWESINEVENANDEYKKLILDVIKRAVQDSIGKDIRNQGIGKNRIIQDARKWIHETEEFESYCKWLGIDSGYIKGITPKPVEVIEREAKTYINKPRTISYWKLCKESRKTQIERIRKEIKKPRSDYVLENARNKKQYNEIGGQNDG
jgi:hypothetical protein